MRDNVDVGVLTRIHQEHPFYGVKRFSMALGWSEAKARRIRNLAGITIMAPRKKHKYSHSRAELLAPANLLKPYARLRNPDRPQDGMDYTGMTSPDVRAWVQDFSYIWLGNGFCYLAVVVDLTTRQIMGWSLGTRHTAELICEALLDALSKNPAPDILHSDRGSEYLSNRHGEVCSSFGIRMSASSPSSPWQNGFMERVFTTLKHEMPSVVNLRDEAKLYELVATEIHYYNTKRIHTSLGMPPATYARKLLADKKNKKLLLGKKLFQHPKTTQIIPTKTLPIIPIRIDRVLRKVRA